MSFSFAPKNDEEIHAIQNQGLLPEGVYPFQVKAVEQLVSKTGNSMLKIRLSVLEKDGSSRTIFDYLVATDQMIFKLKHFCEAIGLEDKYSKGCFEPQDCLERSGSAFISVQKGSAKPDGSGNYPDKNQVKDYVKANEVAKPKAAAVDKDFDDDIKF